MLTMNGIYDGGRVKLNEKYKINQRCEVLVVFSENYTPVRKKISRLDNLLNKINSDNIHEEVSFGMREGNEIILK